MTLGEIIDAVGGFSPSAKRYEIIRAITTDTRESAMGDLFFALRGRRYSGEDFCAEAEGRGCFVISESYRSGILVKSTEDALLALASYYKSKLRNIKSTVAVTGSVGKTTTKELLSVLLSDRNFHASKGNFNNYIGLAHTIFSAPTDTELLLLELGANHEGEIEKMSSALRPSIGIITKIGTSHIGNFGSRERIATAKSEIEYGMSDGVLLIPYGEPLLSPRGEFRRVSLGESEADFSLLPTETAKDETLVSFYESGKEKLTAKVRLFGEGNLRALAFSIAASRILGVDYEEIKSHISLISGENTRQNVFSYNNKTIIDDSYNASLESIVCAFDMMKFYRGRRCAVLGDVLELGCQTEAIHFKIGAEATKRGIERLFLLGVYAPFIARGALYSGMPRESITVSTELLDKDAFFENVMSETREGDVILFKASNACGFGEACRALKNQAEVKG